MSYSGLAKHPQFPDRILAVVEQPRGVEKRMGYDEARGGFFETGSRHLLFVRGFTGVYGWIAGTGVPPAVHWDVMVLTGQDIPLGDTVECEVCGVFVRSDGDYKFVAVDLPMARDLPVVDLDSLPETRRRELFALYPEVGPGEGWFGAAFARDLLSNQEPLSD